MYEAAWNYIKAKDCQRAYRSLDLMLLQEPDTREAPSLRLLEGNLQLRMSNFYLASDAFSKMRDEFEPIHRQLQQVIVKSQTDPAYFDVADRQGARQVRHRGLRPHDGGQVGPAEPEVARMMALADEVGDIQRDLPRARSCSSASSASMDGSGRVGIFPDLAAHRTKSTEIIEPGASIRGGSSWSQIRAIVDPVLTAEERKALDQVAASGTP